MGLSKFFLNTGEALRPVLTKIIPMMLPTIIATRSILVTSKLGKLKMPQTSCRLILLKNMRQEDTNVVPI